MRQTIIRFFMAILALGAIPLTVQAKETLTIYTYESFVADWGPGPGIKKSFEAQCDCLVKWVGIEDGVALLNRLKLEGASATADLVLGLDTGLIAEARDMGLFAPAKVDTSQISLPMDWRDDVFIPYDFAHFAVIYDRKKVPAAPRSLKELVESESGYKIVLQDPRTSTPGLGFLLWVKSVFGDRSSEAWRRLKPKILTVTPGWSEAYGLFTKGEADMVLSYTTSPAYHLIAEDSDQYAAAEFAEGHYLQIEVAAALKNAKNPELARRFLAFMTGPGFQDHIPTNNWMFPAGKTSSPLPEAFATLVKPAKTFHYDPKEVFKMRRIWTDEWLEVMSR